jgi:hypothetical protein
VEGGGAMIAGVKNVPDPDKGKSPSVQGTALL